MKLSIVTTLYKSAGHLQEFYRRGKISAEKITSDYEILLVNDGSPDESLNVAIGIQKVDPHIAIIDLGRNFGQHRAMMTGLSMAKGDFIFLLDSDLEEEPEWLDKFWQRMHQEPDIDVVYGVQLHRKGKWFERISGETFYRMFNFLSYIKIPKNPTAGRLMKAPYVKELLRFPETEIFIPGVWASTGFRQIPVTVVKKSRSATTYSIGKKMTLFVDSITSFSNKPLVLIFYMGTIITLLSSIWICWIIYNKIALGVSVMGWASLMASVLLIGGIIIFSIGVLGIYLAKIFVETKRRPLTTVKKIYGRS